MILLLKLAGGGCVLVAAFGIANSLNTTLEQRKKQLRLLYGLLLQLKSEIQYMGNTLPESFRNLSKGTSNPFSDWLTELAKRLEDNQEIIFETAWKDSLIKLQEQSCLLLEDVEPVLELSKRLGSADSNATLKAIDYALIHIERNRIDLEKEMEQRKKVISTLSMFAGFLVLILLW